MAMLAEPRRKQKVINLRAKNNAWSNDSTKFGQRMLEKMGWTSGKGLGANESGITEHVVARYKNDEKGLGFEDKNDQWTKHEDDFNTLLANLSNASDTTENHHSGVSLEDKSKKSKARIHYHKFTRGKDISRYSEKDLANIFGKKSFKNTEEPQEHLKEDLKTTEQIFTEKGSMEDYFKNKLADFKLKSKLKVHTLDENNLEYDEPSYGFAGFSQEPYDIKSSGEIGYEQESKNNNDVGTKMGTIVTDIETIKKKKNKSKTQDKNDIDENLNENLNYADQQHEHENDECTNGKLKKKKSKNRIQLVDNIKECPTSASFEECPEEKLKKKKSKNKHKPDTDAKEYKSDYTNSCEISTLSSNDTGQKKKKKKSKNGVLSTDLNSESELNQAQFRQEKKKNSFKTNQLVEDNIVPEDTKIKKSKRKNDQNIEDIMLHINDIENIPKKKKKRKNKDKE